MGFQNRVNQQLPIAVAGDFASGNPRAVVLPDTGGFVAGIGGVTVGKFAWIDDDGHTVHNFGSANRAPDGFVHREGQALITEYLGEASMIIPQGFPVTLMSRGDFFAKVTGSTAATYLAAIYATFSTGDITIGSAATGASVTGSIGSTNTGSLGSTFTATGTGTSFAVTALTGYLAVGDTISGTGVTPGTTITAQVSGTTGAAGTYTTSAATTSAGDTITSFGSTLKTTVTTGLISVSDIVSGGAGFPVGAHITAQVSGTTGGAGVYTLSAPGSAYVASTTGVTTYGTVVHVTAIGSGSLAVGDPITGSGVPSGAVISDQIDGAPGGIGNYRIDVTASAYAASTTITAVGGILTVFKAANACAVGELVKITTWE